MRRRVAVLLMAHGAVERLEDIEPYLRSVLGREPSTEVVGQVRERYRDIGGCSPLASITRSQARGLEAELCAEAGTEFMVREGFRHWTPSIAGALEQLLAWRPDALVVLPLTPYYSRLSTGRYYEAFEAALAVVHSPPRVVRVLSWHAHPLLIQALAAQLTDVLATLPPERRQAADILFTAHSLPRRLQAEGDPYIGQIEDTIRRVGRQAEIERWSMAFQSRGAGVEPWVGPDAESVLDALARQGTSEVILHPVGFLSDHLETLYDDDVLLRRLTAGLGLRFTRVPCLNASPRLIAALGALVGHRLAAARSGVHA